MITKVCELGFESDHSQFIWEIQYSQMDYGILMIGARYLIRIP